MVCADIKKWYELVLCVMENGDAPKPNSSGWTFGHGVPMHTSLQELEQAAAGGNPKPLARDTVLPPTSQAKAEADLEPMQYHKILLTWQYQIQ